VKERIDKILSDRKLVASRSQAKSLIEKGDVLVNGAIVKKAGELISVDSDIVINSEIYVGRGAFKLKKALEKFKTEVKGKVLLDVGASTGGFTEILLAEGAHKVFAIDVGHGQLAPKIREDSRVVNMEGTNIKDVYELPEVVDGAVMDLSFISITKVLPALTRLVKSQGFLIALVKPQFEVGPERLPKDGVVKDETLRELVLKEVNEAAVSAGWILHASILSPIEGKSGNVEYLSYFTRT
jgi:23S rRNA (cytidine1920-2'-O)/16S rRNA (cytidine1409-2'-O)-methyltransferase